MATNIVREKSEPELVFLNSLEPGTLVRVEGYISIVTSAGTYVRLDDGTDNEFLSDTVGIIITSSVTLTPELE
jgi:hypothetical protein